MCVCVHDHMGCVTRECACLDGDGDGGGGGGGGVRPYVADCRASHCPVVV